MACNISMLPTLSLAGLRLFYLAIAVGLSSACTAVKPYQRAYLNDPAMQTGSDPSETFEQSVFWYREGGLISTGTKGKGGCGCN